MKLNPWTWMFALIAVPFVVVQAVAYSMAPTVKFIWQCLPAPSTTCTVASTGSPSAAYSWEWGDGRMETHTQPYATNGWMKPGTYTVTLTVTTKAGVAGRVSNIVMVGMPPVVVHDTAFFVTKLPQPLPGVSMVHVDSASAKIGNATHIYSFTYLGSVDKHPDGRIEAYRSAGPPTYPATAPGLALQALSSIGTYPTLVAAVKGLLTPPAP